MSRITGVVVALATAATVLSGSTAEAAPPPGTGGVAGTADLPREIPGGVELRLADGDLLRVWASESYRTVRARRLEATTGVWSDPVVVLRRKRLFCGDVDARTAGGAVAVVAECDRGGYSEDEAPTSSQALWSPDTVTWSANELEGEAYEEPGISPGGTRAIYPESGGYVTFGPEGFVRHRLETPGQEYTATATITDDAQVSCLYGSGLASHCSIVVLTRTGDEAPVRQELAPDDACSDTDFANVDAFTTLFGWFGDPGQVAVISRPDASSPWAVTQVAPQDAPGLVLPDEWPLDRQFFSAPGVPLVALGSRTSRRVRAQVYDPVAQAWGPATTIHQARARCTWSDADPVGPLAVLVAVVTCGDDNVVLTTRDGVSWQALRMGPRPLGQSRDGRYVAVPSPTSTHVISPERGVVTLPGGVGGARCDVVVPDGPDAAVRVVATRGSRRWPVRLERVSALGSERLGRVAAPTPGRCSDADQFYDDPGSFDMISTTIDRGQVLRIVRRGDGWKARAQAW